MPSRANSDAQLGHSKPVTCGRASGICFRRSLTGVRVPVAGNAVRRAMTEEGGGYLIVRRSSAGPAGNLACDSMAARRRPVRPVADPERRGATHASVHTTISTLEGLHQYERHRARGRQAVRAAQHRGREFLLAHRLFRSHRTGEVIKPVFTRFSFPPRWHYDILRALDYFQAVDAPRDERLTEAIEIVRSKQRRDGGWPLQHRHNGRTYFELERLGAPSRWNTLRALRVLKWWERP
jgi:hypothetical protein